MRPSVPLSAVLLTAPLAALLVGLAPAASATPAPVPTPSASAVPDVSPTPSPADSEETPQAEADPCAPVDGEVPLMCQAGVPQQAPAGPAQLPLTGRDDVPALAAGALLLLVAGTGLAHAGRRTA